MARFRQLDSLRGLAAASVMMYHFVAATFNDKARHESMPLWGRVTFDALHPFLLGQEAVIFFFVLSGLVLAFAIPKRQPLRYGSYVVHRFCRIYLPYLFSLMFTIGACFAFHGMLPPWSEWLASAWRVAPSMHVIMQHILFIWPHEEILNSAYWSLVIEIRVSLLMPFMVMAMQRLNLRRAFWLCLILSVADAFAQAWIAFHLSGAAVNWWATMHYAIFFLYGVFIALHGDVIRRWIQRMPHTARRILLSLAAIVTFYVWAAVHTAVDHVLNLDLITALGTATIICFCMFDEEVAAHLLARPLLWLGRISYSLYLLHIPVFFSLLALLGNRLSYLLLLPLGVALSLGLAECMVRFIETPSQRLGRQLDRAYSA